MTGNGAAARAQVKGGLHTHARAREQGAEVAGKAELGARPDARLRGWDKSLLYLERIERTRNVMDTFWDESFQIAYFSVIRFGD